MTEIPHEQIRDEQDRSWTFRVLERALDPALEDEFDDSLATLSKLDDYRIVERLLTLLEDLSQPWEVRDNARCIVASCTTWETAERRRSWWASGDDLLMHLAIQLAEETESDLLRPILSDPEHDLHEVAFGRLIYSFRTPEFQPYVIAGLSSPSADVRAAAAEHCYWEEPHEATPHLLRIASTDPDDEAADQAAWALAYYRSQAVLRGLTEAVKSAGETRRERLECSLYEVRNDAATALFQLRDKPNAQKILQRWLSPVMDILDRSEFEERFGKAYSPSPETQREPISLDALIAWFSDPDRKCALDDEYAFRAAKSSLLSLDEKLTLGLFISQHPDWSIRDRLFMCMSAADVRPEITFTMMHDAVFSVQKTGVYNALFVAPDTAFADRLWWLIEHDSPSSCYASELVESYNAHESEESRARQRMLELAITDELNLDLRAAAVHALSKRQAIEELSSLVPLLNRPPLPNWQWHSAVISECIKHDIKIPRISDLADVDDWWLQSEIAEYRAARM